MTRVIQGIREAWIRYNNFGVDKLNNPLLNRQAQFLNAAFLVGLVACLGATLLIIPRSSNLLALSLWLLGSIGLFSLFTGYRLTVNIPVYSRCFVVLMYVINIYLLYLYPYSSGIYWLFISLPIFTILLSKRSLYYNVLVMILLIPIIHLVPSDSNVYSWREVISFTVSFAVVGICLVFYRQINEAAEQDVTRQRVELGELTTKLTREVAMKSNSESQLKILASSLSDQNQKLSHSRLALVNLLEDAHELEAQLEESKKSVDQKIIQRTQQLAIERASKDVTLQNLPVGVILTDAYLRIVDVNSTAYSLLDITNNKLTSNNKNKLTNILKKSLGLFDPIREMLTHQSSIVISDIEYADKIFQISLSPVKQYGHTSSIGVIIVIEDISKRQMLERSKNEFLMIASHELRTPLTAIRGNSVLLEKIYSKQINDPNYDELLSDISHSSKRLLDIVNDYLELASLEQGMISFNIKQNDLYKLAKETCNEFKTLAEAKGISLTLRKPKSPPLGMVDSARFQQIVANLISNAIHYTLKGGVTLSFRESKDEIECRVSDTGVGISLNNQKMLFGKFQQAQDNPLTRDPNRSTGLGLYIAQQLINHQGGSIKLESSKLKQGSIFLFTIPKVKVLKHLRKNDKKRSIGTR